jgi:hypothetical protein
VSAPNDDALAKWIRLQELKAAKRWLRGGWWKLPELERELLELEILAGVPWVDL